MIGAPQKYKYANIFTFFILQLHLKDQLIFLKMDNLNEQQYELVLRFMQENDQENFMEAANHLAKFQFNYQNAVDGLNPEIPESDYSVNEEEQMDKMKKYLLKRIHSNQNKMNFKDRLSVLKKSSKKLCLTITQKLMPQIIKRKLIRSPFHCIYYQYSVIQLQFRDLEEANLYAKKHKKQLVTLISPPQPNQTLIAFLKQKRLLSFIEKHFIIFGTLSNDLEGTILEGRTGPSIVFLRENRYQDLEILQIFENETEIMRIKEQTAERILQQAKHKFERQKYFIERTSSRLINDFQFEESVGTMTNEIQQERENNYLQNHQKSKMIKEQNKIYEEMATETHKKQKQREEKIRLQEEKRQQRQLRKMSIPEEPQEGLKILFRCPNGETISRKFQKSQKIQFLYNWVELNDEIEFEEERQFDLFYSYPPQSLQERKEEELSTIFEEMHGKILIRQL